MGGSHTLGRTTNPAEDAFRRVEVLQELMNKNKWEDDKQNQGIYNLIQTH